AGQGNDVLFGEDGNDSLNGQEGNDTLMGGAGNDIIGGQQGDDVLIGGTGTDTYIFNRGDGRDTVIDTEKDSTLILGKGISASDINLRLGSLELDLDLGNGDQVHIDGFDPNDVFNSSSVSSFDFADGTKLNRSGMLLCPTFLCPNKAADFSFTRRIIKFQNVGQRKDVVRPTRLKQAAADLISQGRDGILANFDGFLAQCQG
ncbi:MAG: calcium-binding protein, partial [Methylobacter sp.]